MTAIYKKEFHSYFNNMMGYAVVAIMLLIINLYVAIINFHTGYTNLEYSMQSCSLLFVVVIPLLTMRSFVEERRQHTDQLLMTSPATTANIVIGKYLAQLTVFAIPVAAVCFYPIIFSAFGTVNYSTAYMSIVGFLLLGMTLISIGTFISSLTDSYVVAALASLSAMMLMYFMGNIKSAATGSALVSLIVFTVVVMLLVLLVYAMTHSTAAAVAVGCAIELVFVILYFTSQTLLSTLLSDILGWLAIYDRSSNFFAGIFDITAVVYYAGITVLFLFMTGQAVEKRRWS